MEIILLLGKNFILNIQTINNKAISESSITNLIPIVVSFKEKLG